LEFQKKETLLPLISFNEKKEVIRGLIPTDYWTDDPLP